MTDSTTTYGPFGRAAALYRAAGWFGTLPLGPRAGMKFPPPKDWTGAGAPYPSGADVAAWTETHADRNIGLRMPPGVIGLDVDQYGLKTGADTLAQLEARFGPLPPTWVSSARPAPSGIRFYRVPTELDGREINWPGEAGKFIEIIQPGHRYAVVWPSTNPEADGARYEWHFDDGAVHDGVIPHLDSLAPLPDAWVRGLALSYDRTDKAQLDDAGQASWWSKLRTQTVMCPVVHSVGIKAGDDLREVAGARHETARDAVAALVRLGGEGHAGVRVAVAHLGERFELAVGSERIANGEWQRLLSGAVRLAAADNPTPRQCCEHDPATRLDMELPPLPPPTAVADPHPDAPMDAPALTPESVGAELAGLLDATATQARMRSIVPALAALPVAARQEWRALFKLHGMPYGQFDELLRAAEAERRRGQLDALRERRTREGWLQLSPPSNPMAVARELLAQTPNTDDVWHTGHWRGEFYRWHGTHWAPLDDADVRNWVYRTTERAFYVDNSGDEPKEPAWQPDPRKVNAVVDALGTGVLHRSRDDEHEPCIALTNCVYDLATDTELPHHPARWNLTALPFAFDRSATCPQWLTFLAQVLPADSIIFLQEWIGYLVSGRTDHQKIASLIGLPRSGKGTINRIITALLGRHAVAGPMLGSLIGPFGLEPLLGKSLATFADVKWTARGVGDATELLKTISGEDGVTVHRKNRVSWEGRLPTRFMLMSNDTPSFTDASGALGDRLIHIKFAKSFMKNPDIGLTDRLMIELPGILLWAVEGLRRLDERGRFHVPADSAEIDEDVRRTASPHMVFLAEECEKVPGRVKLDDVWAAWEAWCRADGTEAGTKPWLTRKLKAVWPHITTIEEKSDNVRIKYLTGLRVNRPQTTLMSFSMPAPVGHG